MSESSKPHFVWVRGTGNRPSPQKWSELNYGVNNHKLKSGEILGKPIPLTDALWALPIDELAKLYPPPKG